VNHELGLRVLSQIMDWDDDEARKEFRWLSFMSRYKYDGYRDYLAGARFFESLATWLQQFSIKDREVAYKYLKDSLVYVGPAEMQRLIVSFFPEIVQRHLVNTVSRNLSIPEYKVWSSEKAIKKFDEQLRKTLFMGLSDGARIDVLRRVNAGVINNEQVVAATQIDTAKWESLIKDLRSDLKKITGQDNSDRFSRIYLIDDFTASGTSLLRFSEEENKYKGKLARFHDSLKNALQELKSNHGDILDDNWKLIVHHYIGTENARSAIGKRYAEVVEKKQNWFPSVEFTFGTIFPSTISLDITSGHPFVDLCKKYYDPSIEDRHSAECGDPSMTFGYGQCALPVVLEHNTPNNSLPLLWAETSGNSGYHAMRPLFRRRQRHNE